MGCFLTYPAAITAPLSKGDGWRGEESGIENWKEKIEKRSGWGNKKSHGKRGGLPWLHLIAMLYTDGFVSTRWMPCRCRHGRRSPGCSLSVSAPRLPPRFASGTPRARSGCTGHSSVSTAPRRSTGSRCSPATAPRHSRPTRCARVSVSAAPPFELLVLLSVHWKEFLVLSLG